MKHALVFVTMTLVAAAGTALGSVAGQLLGSGGLIVGGAAIGIAGVVAAGFLCERRGWIKHADRLWTILGGVFGFVSAGLVVLSTLGSTGPLFSAMLVGAGAVMGEFVGRSPHGQA